MVYMFIIAVSRWSLLCTSAFELLYLKGTMNKSFIQVNYSAYFIGVLVQNGWKKIFFSRGL